MTDPSNTDRIRRLATSELLRVGRPPTTPEPSGSSGSHRLFGMTAAVVGAMGLAASLFVGWAVPLPIAAVVAGIVSLRREVGAEVPAHIGIYTGIAGIAYSAVWFGYYLHLFGAIS